MGIFNWYYPSSPPQALRPPVVHLESKGLIYVSDLDLVWAPQLFYTRFYNHAHRPRLEKLLYLELSRRSNGF
jgi:hypothetical protein